MSDVFTEYAWVKPLKDQKKVKQFLNKSNRKPYKLWVDQGTLQQTYARMIRQ